MSLGAKARRQLIWCICTYDQQHSTDESEQSDSQPDHSNNYEASDHLKRRDCGVGRQSIVAGKHVTRFNRFVLRRPIKRLTP